MTDADNDKIVKVVELNAPISRVWNALTDHEEFGQWFRVSLDQPFEAGVKSTGQMTYPGHEDVAWVAYIERMEPERLFSFRWYDSDEGSTEQSEGQPGLLVEFRLEEVPDGMRLTITESGFSALPDPRRIEAMRSNEEGWNIQADNLTEHLSA
ncbi:MAG: vanillate O-demethylase oxidoreductase VanB [Alphaproteobacteria bacterium]|nr:vanillate O-demethylase oxidoreductase VanB [Alphaproteobacteria bacterium]